MLWKRPAPERSGASWGGFKRRTLFLAWLALMPVIIGGGQLMTAREYAANGLESVGQVLSSRQMRGWPREHWSRIYFVDEWGREYIRGLSHGGPALARGQPEALKYLPRSPQTTAILKRDAETAWWAWPMTAAGLAGLLFLGRPHRQIGGTQPGKGLSGSPFSCGTTFLK